MTALSRRRNKIKSRKLPKAMGLVKEPNGENNDETKTETSAVIIQKRFRGWLVRKHMQKLQEKVILDHEGDLKKKAYEVKGIMSRIMQRTGQTTTAPFSYSILEDYLDRTKRCMDLFQKKSMDGHLLLDCLEYFYQDMGLTFTKENILRNLEMIRQVCSSRADVVLLVDLPVSLGDETFGIHLDCISELVFALHVGKDNVRIGYIPFNSDVFVGFRLDQCATKKSLLKALDNVRYHDGIHRTDLALKKMRVMFKECPRDAQVPRIAIMISEGGGFISHVTRKQARECRIKDKVDIFGIGLGRNCNTDELVAVCGDEKRVFVIPKRFFVGQIRRKLFHQAHLKDCRHCEWQTMKLFEGSNGNGLTLEETLELMWQLAPPGTTVSNY